jgi:hypothetical protein
MLRSIGEDIRLPISSYTNGKPAGSNMPTSGSFASNTFASASSDFHQAYNSTTHGEQQANKRRHIETTTTLSPRQTVIRASTSDTDSFVNDADDMSDNEQNYNEIDNGVLGSRSSHLRLCQVCELNKAQGYRFGGLICNSCKCFFRYCSQINYNQIDCLDNRNCCDLSKQKGNMCRKCRLVKCFKVGMRPAKQSQIDCALSFIEINKIDVNIKEVGSNADTNQSSPIITNNELIEVANNLAFANEEH